jgi:hypothetical protein
LDGFSSFDAVVLSVCYAWQENIPIEEVFQSLKCSRQGLSSEEAEARLAVFGPNKLEEKKVVIFSSIIFLLCNNGGSSH